MLSWSFSCRMTHVSCTHTHTLIYTNISINTAQKFRVKYFSPLTCLLKSKWNEWLNKYKQEVRIAPNVCLHVSKSSIRIHIGMQTPSSWIIHEAYASRCKSRLYSWDGICLTLTFSLWNKYYASTPDTCAFTSIPRTWKIIQHNSSRAVRPPAVWNINTFNVTWYSSLNVHLILTNCCDFTDTSFRLSHVKPALSSDPDINQSKTHNL